MGNNLLIIAGEPSGDALGGPLAKHIFELKPDLHMWGYGGDSMSKAGVEILTPVGELAVMGFRDVVGRLPEMFRRMSSLTEEAVRRNADGAVLIDYPGFNIRLAERLAKHGIPIVYYVSPQVWAWKPGRIKKLAKSISRMLTILPFEKELYEEEGVPVSYVGHYFVDEVIPTIEPSEFRRNLQFDEPLLLILPGSRKQEVSRLLEIMIEAFSILKSQIPDLTGLVVKAPDLPDSLFEYDLPDLKMIEGEAINAMFASTAALCCSGSATLQCAVAGLPHVITYRTDPLSVTIFRSLVRTDFIGLSNLVAGKGVSPEFIQSDATPRNLAEAVKPYIIDNRKRTSTIEELNKIKKLLGAPEASKRAAKAVIEEIYG